MTLDSITQEELNRTERLSKADLLIRASPSVTGHYVPLKIVEDIYQRLATAAARLGLNAHPAVLLAYERKKRADQTREESFASGEYDNGLKNVLQKNLEAVHLLAQALARYKR